MDLAELKWLNPDFPVFPKTADALEEPAGLLAAGGNLKVGTLLSAYYRGIFPWYSDGEPPLWWAPNPRAVLLKNDLHLSRSAQKLIRRQPFSFSTDRAFTEVIERCAYSRADETWIVDEMIDAYQQLHDEGAAHSIEVWQDDTLVGGLYGVQVGSVYCGESMFHEQPNASKLAFACLAQGLFAHGFTMIDCQLNNPFLESLGVHQISRCIFETKLVKARDTAIGWPQEWALNPKPQG